MKKGVLLVNVGTPESLTLEAVKSYLDEFLSDPYVIAIPDILRKILVKGIIVPFRSPKSLNKYRRIWTENGSPLRSISNQFAEQLQAKLGDHYLVKNSMRYGLPSLSSAFEEFAEQAIKEVFVLPLYPQWSQSTTDSVILKVDELNAIWKVKIDYLSPFYQDKGFLKSHQELIENSIQKFNPDFVIFSFHGLPDKPVAQRYFRECHETAKLLSFYLKNIPWKTSFQSRLGFNKWLEPSTENTIAEAAQKGFLRLMVVSPSFVVDGLETLEELALEGAEQFKKLTHDKGQFYLVPSLNLSPTWVETVQQWVHQHFQSGKL